MDKFVLLTYTSIAKDGLRRWGHAWFSTEEEMKLFLEKEAEQEIEVDVAIEILSHREIEL